MSEKKIEKKKKKKLSTSALVLIISCIIIAIPVIIFLFIIISSSLKNNVPNVGDRFKNDLNPAITESQQESIISDVKTISGVEDCEVVLTTAQLRINVDAKDSLSELEAEDIGIHTFEAVNKNLPVGTYFTQSSDGQRMYDLEITVYNFVPETNTDPNWVCLKLTKNSSMEKETIELVSEPKNPELAKELNGETAQSEEPETKEETAK